MSVIFKYPLQPTDEQLVHVPGGAGLLTAQMQGGEMMLWAVAEPGQPNRAYKVRVIGTGNAFKGWPGTYLCTVQMGSALVWHVFWEPA